LERYLSPSETARRFGVSIKALRLYEQRGLLSPKRSRSGTTGSPWRLYGPDEITRLHQILTLKCLGLSLARIGELLGDVSRLKPMLALQERMLVRDGARVARALAQVRAARAKLSAGAALSIDDLANLTKETVMTVKPGIEEVEAIFAPLTGKYFTEEERRLIQKRKPALAAEWEALKSDIRSAMASGEPASPALAERRKQLAQSMTGGDEALLAKIRAFSDEAMADPKLGRFMDIDPDMYDFLKQVG
jgi:DNA-binding transcriptional MerR regulator